MSKLRLLNERTHEAVKSGHFGVFTQEDLALMMGDTANQAFLKYLHKAVKAGVLNRIAVGLYYNPLAGIKTLGVLEHIATLLHWKSFLYISLESQLSHIGVISQIPMKRLTVMTTGRSGETKTPFGVIEFTHTSKDPDSLVDELYFDPEVGMLRAKKDRAIADLKRVGRNQHMLMEGHVDERKRR